MKIIFYLTTLLFLTASTVLFGQQKSTYNFAPLSQKPTIAYMDSLYEAAHQYDLDGHLDSARYLAKLCITLGTKSNYNKGILQGRKINTDCILVEGNTVQALKDYQEIVDAAKKKKYNDLAAVALFEMSTIYCTGEFLKAKLVLDEATLLNCGKNAQRLIADIDNVKGILYDYADSLPQAVSSYLNAYKIYDKIGKEDLLLKVLNNVTSLLIDNGIYSLAEFYANQAIERSQKSNSAIRFAFALINKIELCKANGKWDSVKYYVEKVEAIVVAKTSTFTGYGYFKSSIQFNDAMYLQHFGNIIGAEKLLSQVFMSSEIDRTDFLKTGYELVLDYLIMGKESQAKAIMDSMNTSKSHNNFRFGSISAKKENLMLAQIKLAYTIYITSTNHSWLPAFREQVLHMPEKILMNQGLTKLGEIFGFDENYAKADYILVQERVKYQAVALQLQNDKLQLKQKNLNYLIGFLAIATVLVAIMLFLYRRNVQLVAKQKEANKILKQNNAYLQLYDRAISHDLASPIGLVNDCAQSLQQPNNLTNEMNQLFLLSIVTESDKALKQIKSLLKMGMQEEYNAITETRLYEKLLIEAIQLAKPGNLNVEIRDLDLLPLMYMDQSGLKEIFKLLLSNAVKHTGMGDDLKVIVLGRYTSGDKYCYIDITDNGIGISKPNLDKIFDVKFSASSSAGSGIGLAICRVIMEKYHGSIVCQSTQGIGTAFTLAFLVDGINKTKI